VRDAKERWQDALDERIQSAMEAAIGPAPWYWKTFPPVTAENGTRFEWRCLDDLEKVGRLITLNPTGKEEDRRLILGLYSRPFIVPPNSLGIWFPGAGHGHTVELIVFDPKTLTSLSMGEIKESFKDRNPLDGWTRWRRYLASPKPIAKINLDGHRPEGVHKVAFPDVFKTVDELLIVTGIDPGLRTEAAAVILDVRPVDDQVTVYPQKWYSIDKFDTGYQWITRVWRNPLNDRFMGDGFRISPFELTDDNCHIMRRFGLERYPGEK
jgi:hypothetical protein